MSGKKLIAITQEMPESVLLAQIENLAKSGIDSIILRRKDLSEQEYFYLAKEAIKICEKHNCICVLHNFYEVALKLNHPYFHAPFCVAESLSSKSQNLDSRFDFKKYFKIFGVSIHSEQELQIAHKAKADYVIFGHIFESKSKDGIKPKGIKALENLSDLIAKNALNLELYAIGGISLENLDSIKHLNIQGVCMRSSLMEIQDCATYVKKCQEKLGK